MTKERQQEEPESALQTLKECDGDEYSNINNLLQIMCSLLVSVRACREVFQHITPRERLDEEYQDRKSFKWT